MDNFKYKAKNGINGQLLNTHLLAVGLKCFEISKNIFNNDLCLGNGKLVAEELPILSAISGLIHDIGKTDADFQKHISANEKESASFDEAEENDTLIIKGKFVGPFHNEISALIFEELYEEPVRSALLAPSDDKTKDINKYSLAHTLYFHHAANCIFDGGQYRFLTNTYGEIRSKIQSNNDYPQLLKDSQTMIENVFEEFKKITNVNISNELIKKNNSDIEEKVIPKFNYSGRYLDDKALVLMGDEAVKKILLTILIEADVEISKLSEYEAKEYINNFSKRERELRARDWKVKKIEDLSKRTLEQIELAEKVLQSQLSIIGADTGIGKTVLSLLSTNTSRINILLPKINQVDALEIQKNANHIYNKKLKIKRIHSRSDNVTLEEDDDVRIMVFDKGLSTLFDRRYHNIGFDLINSDLVIDEFQEFPNSPSMIIPLKVFIEIRRLTNFKTVLLSGTPDRGLLDIILPENWNYKRGITFFDRSSLSPTDSGEHKRIKIALASNIGSLGKDTLITYNSTIAAQEMKIAHEGGSLLCHSKLTSKDLNAVINQIKTEHSEGMTGGDLVISPKMLSSSYDISFKNVTNLISSPSIDTQTLGRCNRHQTKDGSAFTFIIEDRVSSYISKCLNQKQTHIKWKSFLRSHPLIGKELTHREFAVEFYEAFFNVPANLKTYKDEIFKAAKEAYLVNVVEKWFPIKGRSRAVEKFGKTQSIRKTSTVGFRGTSLFISMKIVDPKTLMPIGQLLGDECLTSSEVYNFENFKEMSSVWCNKKHPKDKRYFGGDDETPFILSWFEEGDESKFIEKGSKKTLKGICTLNRFDKEIYECKKLRGLYTVYIPNIGAISLTRYLEILKLRVDE